MRPVISSLALVLILTSTTLAAPSKAFEEHKKKAQIAYELAEYEKAIEEYKAAYAISQESWILYNIAQAYRLKKDCALATRFYKNYVAAVQKGKDPAPERTKHAQEQLPLMEKCAAEKKSAAPPPAEEPKPPPPAGGSSASPTPAASEPIPSTSPLPEDPPTNDTQTEGDGGRWKRIAGLSLLGGGAVLAGVGVYYNLQARDKEQELEDKFTPDDPMFWTPEDEQLRKDMESDRTRAVILYVVGGACVAGGAVLTYLGFTERAPEAVALVPLRGGGAFSASFRF